ncbi:MAG: thiamine phosphate synthase [Flavobacteriales bacterium]|nr:thiamine phosphate synthase [Flavobacteriales bacterium]
MSNLISKLQYITAQEEPESVCANVSEICALGIDWIQLRIKDLPPDQWKSLAIQCQTICKLHDVTFILNDNVELCKEINADGVHLGKADMNVKEARRFLGDNFIIGATANTYKDLLRVEPVADYIGLGPLRRTQTKKQLSPILGVDGVQDVMKKHIMDALEIPVVVVGGVIPEDILRLTGSNVHGVAISAALKDASDRNAVIADFKEQLEKSNKERNGIITNSGS